MWAKLSLAWADPEFRPTGPMHIYLILDPQILSEFESWGEEVSNISPGFQNRLQYMTN